MKRLEEIENISMEELEAIADSSAHTLPKGAQERLSTLLACEKEAERKPAFAGFAFAAVFACICAAFVLVGVRNSAPRDTFSDPKLAYAEVEKAFSRIGSEMNKGARLAEKSGEKLSKPAQIINNITHGGELVQK